jgi:Ribbon-helix-helix protein, copG family
MTRTTIALPDDLARLVAHEARRRETSISEIVRRALASHLGLTTSTRKLGFVGLGRSGQRHTARDAETILAREWIRARRR